MTIFAALLCMALAVLAIEATALMFRATLPKEGLSEADWHPIAEGTDRLSNRPPAAA